MSSGEKIILFFACLTDEIIEINISVLKTTCKDFLGNFFFLNLTNKLQNKCS